MEHKILYHIPILKQLLSRLDELEAHAGHLEAQLANQNEEICLLEQKIDVLKSAKEKLELQSEQLSMQNERLFHDTDRLLEKEEEESKRLDARIDYVKRELRYWYYKGLHPDNYKAALLEWHYERKKVYPDLDEPKTFNDKIQWLKLYDSTPIKTKLADKYQVREWIEKKIGGEYLVPLLGVWEHAEDIDFDNLPNSFVLKTNHSSGWNLIVRNKEELDYREVRRKFDGWLRKNFAFVFGMQLHYMNIPPRIIAEEYIAGLDGDIYDYRFFCFNGVPRYVWVDLGSGTEHHKRNVYDLQWNLQDCRVNYPPIIPEPKRPATLEKMISLAGTLCEGFAFVRVDFYSVEDRIYFGEMTFTPQSGTGEWEHESDNLHYGELIQLPEKSPMPERKW